MANQARGEIEIKLCKQTKVLKPDFEGMLEAEDKIGKPLPLVFSQWGSRSPSLREVVAVIYGGLLWDKDIRGRSLTFEEVGSRVLETGHMNLIVPVIKIVKAALVPPTDDEEVAKKKVGSTSDNPTQDQPLGEPTSALQSSV